MDLSDNLLVKLENDLEIVKYYLIYLSDRPSSYESFLNSEYRHKLDMLIGDNEWHKWFINLVKMDPDEYDNFMKVSSNGNSLILQIPCKYLHYISGHEYSLAYLWLVSIVRELKFKQLEIK